MRILYISAGNHMDYQDDSLSIGLKEILGPNLVDVNKRAHIYTSFPEETARQMYGKGMTVTRILEDVETDRSDIENKIRSQYFDLVIYGSIARCSDYLEMVVGHYPKNRVFVVDGEDHDSIYKEPYALGLPYFKRELAANVAGVYPISFAIPTGKVSPVHLKVREIAICDPRNTDSYIYKTEADYYGGYREAYLAFTTKKAGWDCMRHYEIMANGCLPLFTDIAKCPDMTMTTFNKQLCLDVLADYYAQVPPGVIYEKYCEGAFRHFAERNTTLALGKYVLSKYAELQ